jgi:anti-sigma B factor antagonist
MNTISSRPAGRKPGTARLLQGFHFPVGLILTSKQMTTHTEPSSDGISIVKLTGRMDAQGTQEIESKFMDQACSQKSVIVDLQAVDFLASVGIRTLLVVAKAVAKRGGKMVLLNPDPTITRILEVSGVDSFIPVHRTIEEARRAVSV